MLVIGNKSYAGNLHIPFEINIIVGAYSSIADNVTVLGGKGQHAPALHKECVSSYPFVERDHLPYFPCEGKGDVKIGSDVWIGQGVTILDGVTIGDGSIIGACSVVAKDIPPYAVVVGNPGVIKKYRFSAEIIEKLLEIKWWEWSDQRVRDNIEKLKDINGFIREFEV